LGSIYRKQGDLDKAIEFQEKGLSLQHDDNNSGAAIMLANVAGLYWEKKEAEKAMKYWDRSLKANEKLNNKTGIANVYARYSDVELSKGNFNGAIDYLNDALKLQEEMNNKMGIERIYKSMGNIYFLQKDYLKAREVTLKAFQMAEEFKYPADLMGISMGLTKIYAALGDYKKAYEMEVYHKQMSDSVNSENAKRTALRKDFEYAFQKQVVQDSIKAIEEKKVYEAEINHQKSQRMVLYFGIGLIDVFSIFMYNRFRVTQKQKVIIEKQKALVDEKQKEIIESIHYAKRIQQALLPSEKSIEKNINNLL
jgi:tetratricopeptide (TPR) repeat protein